MESLQELFNLFDKIKSGETVLVEYYPSFVPELGVVALLKYARSRRMQAIIDDNLDSLHTVKSHLKFLGIEEDFSDVLVLKTGGKRMVGNVLKRLSVPTDPFVYLSNYRKASSEIKIEEGPYLNIVLGIERLFAFSKTVSEFYAMIHGIQEFVGNTRRKAFYFVNRERTKEIGRITINPLPELERIATTIVEVTPYPGGGTLRIPKAANEDLLGTELYIPMEVITWSL